MTSKHFEDSKNLFSLKTTTLPSPWALAQIDYSAGNEYMSAHYERYEKEPYFQHSEEVNACDFLNLESALQRSIDEEGGQTGKRIEIIFDARKGFFHHFTQSLQTPTLSSCGFTLENFPSEMKDWTNLDDISSIHLKEIRNNLLPKLFPNENATKSIRNIVFWHPMLRKETHEDTSELSTISSHARQPHITPSASIAPMAHIDTDVGAYPDLAAIYDLVRNNQIKEDRIENDILEALESGHRFMILNVWRNVSSKPISRSPLAFLATHYESKCYTSKENGRFMDCCNDGECVNQFFLPLAKPDMKKSLWYTFPNMSNEECVVFKQYDRKLMVPAASHEGRLHDTINTSDLWHCALPNTIAIQKDLRKVNSDKKVYESNVKMENLRQSFDLRILIVFNEKLTPAEDRFLLSRSEKRRPLLTHDESGCFCDEQALKRR